MKAPAHVPWTPAPANLSSWIAKPDNNMFAATDGDAILGVACVTSCCEVTLNYVSPDVRFRGVSKALLQRLEAKAWNLATVRPHQYGHGSLVLSFARVCATNLGTCCDRKVIC